MGHIANQEIRRDLERLKDKVAARSGRAQLREKLRALRRQLAAKQGKNPYRIYDDKLLEKIIIKQPQNEMELFEIDGISAERLRSYGSEIIALVVRNADPLSPLPERPLFLQCSFCNQLQVLLIAPQSPSTFLCKKCLGASDPRLSRKGLEVQLPTAKDFD